MQSAVMEKSTLIEAIKILNQLDRWEDQAQARLTERRREQRKRFRVQVTVTKPQSLYDIECETDVEVLGADTITRNLSSRGLSFVSRQQINEDKIVITIASSTGESRVVYGEIVRQRHVVNEFWEYGVQFVAASD